MAVVRGVEIGANSSKAAARLPKFTGSQAYIPIKAALPAVVRMLAAIASSPDPKFECGEASLLPGNSCSSTWKN